MNRALAPALALLLAACAGLSGCGLNQAGVTPPADTIAFPASAVLDRDSDWLFVTNSNADLRYNDGSLMALSLTRAAIDRDPADPNHPAWGDCRQVNDANPRSDARRFCCWDVVNHKRDVLNCDERGYVDSDTVSGDANVPDSDRGLGNVRIGSFAAGMVLQRATCPVDYKQGQGAGRVACDTCAGYTAVRDRLLLGVRGDTSLTFIDVESRGPDTPPSLRCVGEPTQPDAPGNFVSCDAQHRVIRAQSGLASVGNDPMPSDTPPPDVPLPDEPYALTIDDDAGLLFIGHLTGNTARAFTGGYSMFDIAPRTKDGPRTSDDPGLEAPRFIAPFGSPFGANSVGAVGISGLKTRKVTRTSPDDPMLKWEATVGVYATSRFVPQVAGLGTTTTCPLPMDATPVREIAAFASGTYYSSPLAGAETRGVEFIDDRRSFVLQRTPPALISFLDSTPTDVLETCGSPTFLDLYDPPNGVGPRLFVTCFADGEIYVFDPTVPRLVKTFRVGRGPAGLVFDEKRSVAYAVGFADNNVSVIDLAPGSPTEYQVIQRIGFPRTIPR
jgi:hypothetical protein